LDFSRLFTYIHPTHAPWIEQLYQTYRQDPEKVEASWRHFFDGMQFGQAEGPAEETSPQMRIYLLMHAYRTYGHLKAHIFPLSHGENSPKELGLELLGFQKEELKRVFPTNGLLKETTASLETIIQTLEKIYCGTVGFEYMGLGSIEMERWIQEQIESAEPSFPPDKKQKILEQLGEAELFETFLHTKYVGQKRFSLEGGETLIPLLQQIIEEGAEEGIDEFVMGMAHRGRLNVLTNILKKPLALIFKEFESHHEEEEGMGDVKYHKGFSSNIKTTSGKSVHLNVTANPSHLESVDPVVEGKVKAKQVGRKDTLYAKVAPLLIHGDASLAGQGVVYECLQLYRLAGYSTGGTLHLVVNNHIGFTATPEDVCSTRYCTDIAKTFSAPVFHVNAEDPEKCLYIAELAVKIRQKFHCDVFIDLNCYRKYGHNEGDEPAFTQPIHYQEIKNRPSIRKLYQEQLIYEKVIEKKSAEEGEEQIKKRLHQELEELKSNKGERLSEEAFEGVWKEYREGTSEDIFKRWETGVKKEQLLELTEKFCTVPSGFTLHPKIEKLLQERKAMVKKDFAQPSIDWGMGEHLAFASLLREGAAIRLSGQDSRRGTFSQRHAVWTDQKSDAPYFALGALSPDQGRFDVYNSPLSEFACLGFEFGYSLASPGTLVLWEAQFGDFANGAQVIIDQYLSSSEQKWLRFSGLVLLLPHGYEGQGPEHSSARIERFLQLAAHANIQVVNPTTPAQYFHLLRRQSVRKKRLPLIVFTPKGLLRLPACMSPLQAFCEGGFEEMIDDPQTIEKPTRIIFCSGKVYYDLIAERARINEKSTLIIRIEQLFPFHHDRLQQILGKYAGIQKWLWVQEEPKNMGAWGYIHPILQEKLPQLQYVGREESASPAVASYAVHVKELKELMQEAFRI